MEELLNKDKLTPGEALLAAGLGKEAIPYLQAAHESEPDRWEHLVNLGSAYRIAADFGKSRGCFVQALEMKPDSYALWNNLSLLLQDEGQFHEATQSSLRAFKLHPSQSTGLALAVCYLREGNWNDGGGLWNYGRQNRSWYPIPGIQPWSGEPVEGRNLIVLMEGGYGDVFMALPWMRELAGQGAHVTLIAWDNMVSLLESCCFIEEVIPKSQRFDGHKFDFQAPVLSLPFLMGMTPETVKPAGRIFDPPEPNVTAMRSALANGGRKKLGLCWMAEENTIPRKFRSIKPGELKPFRHLDCRWINLTLETAPEWVETKPLKSWSDTAALISQLDAVVTVDTAVAHLAGCLKVPTLVVLPLNSDWKWGLGTDRSWWYESVRILRNTDPLRFAPALETVRHKVEEWLRTEKYILD